MSRPQDKDNAVVPGMGGGGLLKAAYEAFLARPSGLWPLHHINPNQDGYMAYMTPETLNRYHSTSPEVTKYFQIHVFLKKHLGSIS